MVGNILAGRYRVDSLIGSGGMANVYKAYDLKEGRTVAIKMLKDEHRDDAEFLRRFEREARAVLILSHPNIVRFYDVGSDGGANFIVLEYLEGSTLKEYIKSNGCLEPRKAVSIVSKVLDALQHAHECGIIHRDIKPQNVIITKAGEVKLTDFGIARDTSSSTRTFAGTNVIGSVHYISPEQAKGDNVTAESDLYSCAVMMYEMLTGKVPFTGDNTVAIALKHLQEDMLPPIEVNPKISRALSDVVMRGAAKDPHQRYHSADEMKKDLTRALKEPHGRFARLAKASKSKEKRAERRANRTLLIAAVSVLGGLIAMAAIVLVFRFTVGAGDIDGGFLVPSLIGKPLDEARNLAEIRGFSISVSDYVTSSEYPAGQVTKQLPQDGAKGKEGDVITVEVSSGSGYATVPDISGCTMQEASLRLSEENLNMGNVDYDPASELPAGQVIRQEPSADTRVPEFDAVNIWISGSETTQVPMPALVGLDTDTALKLLESSGLKQVWLRIVPPEKDKAPETVDRQSPAANMSVGRDALAEVWLTRADPGKYSADIAANVDIADKETQVTVTAVLDSGIQVVIYECKLQPGPQQPVVFTGFLPYKGERKCIVYADGIEVKRINVNFMLR